MTLKLLMFGTGEFALPSFRALLDSPHEVMGLVTQPDRVGRGHHHHVNPMKVLAEERGLPVFQPERASRAESLERLKLFGADLFVVAAYGQILSAKLLGLPRFGAINVHASLLPKYRGAAPINYALWQGESMTGVTIFQIEPALDSGPMLGQVAVEIDARETAGELETRLAKAAPLTLLNVIEEIEQGTTQPRLQTADEVTLAPKLAKEQGLVDWARTSFEIDCHVRAMQPWPQPFTFLHHPERPTIRLLVLAVEPAEIANDETVIATAVVPGEPLTDRRDALYVKTGDGMVRVTRVQPAGKKPMSDADFLRGHSLTAGCRFGADS